MILKTLLALFLLVGTAHADWLKVPVAGDGKNFVSRFTADLSVLPKGVTAWSGFRSDDGSVYYIQVNEDFSKNAPSKQWDKPAANELATESAKVGLAAARVKKPPTKISQWIEWGLTRLANIVASAYAAPITDNFNRADENPLGNSTWTTVSTFALKIVSNRVEPVDLTGSTENMSLYSSWAGTNNQYSQVTIANFTSATQIAGVLLRANTSGPQYYGCIGDGGTQTTIYKNDGGSYSTVAQNTNDTWIATDVVYCEVSGTSFTMKRNGGTVLTGSDAAIASGDPGIVINSEGASAVDSWSADSLAAATTAKQRAVVIQ